MKFWLIGATKANCGKRHAARKAKLPQYKDTKMKTENSVKFTGRDIGIIFDCSCQSADTLNLRMVHGAIKCGMELSADDLAILDRFDNDETQEDDSEFLNELADDALDFLNSLELPDFCNFTIEDNSLFLLPNVDDARDSVDFVSFKTLADARRLGIDTDPENSDYPPSDYRGQWLHISDHGNATLYFRDENGKDNEIWAVV